MEPLIGPLMGLIGSTVGVIGAYLVAVYQIKKQNELKEKENEAMVVISTSTTKKLQFIPTLRIKDLADLKNISSNPKIFPKLSIPVINGGKTPVYNLSIEYALENYNSLQKCIELNDENSSLKFYFDNNQYWFDIKVNHNEIDYLLKSISLPNLSTTDSTSVILSGQHKDFYLPEWYILLSQYYFRNVLSETFKFELKNESRTEANKNNLKLDEPVLAATVRFDDYKLNNQTRTFYLYPSINLLDIDDGAEISFRIIAKND